MTRQADFPLVKVSLVKVAGSWIFLTVLTGVLLGVTLVALMQANTEHPPVPRQRCVQVALPDRGLPPCDGESYVQPNTESRPA